ncbi:MAG TPA: TerB family tellurite resistance protein [Chromatiaceae bacterium]|jgi:uncharacterized tellurite resistance protein B-like protein|nr:TerB family tellurite resistance protein [Chromatiaceae bacterium]HIA08841.1 TerB family tellurite resistance protein [Chromatiaceae bacterium]HIB83592.1 TerB family tellurite resistance protein [Chromatiaceae bacterium]HIN82388.1 TerB family tellurite resistance protein [Chromatiales bacterium]HIO53797.1 TerB family tellurite resistance protein [Chromatiales bacterium]
MLNAITNFFDRHVRSQPADDESTHLRRIKVATAALMVELSRVDDAVTDDEKGLIERQLKLRFDLSEAEAAELIGAANSELDDSSCLYEFTRLVNENLSAQERVEVIELLWGVALADQVLDSYEEHIIRRIADLLYVSHSDFIRTKLKVIGQ